MSVEVEGCKSVNEALSWRTTGRGLYASPEMGGDYLLNEVSWEVRTHDC